MDTLLSELAKAGPGYAFAAYLLWERSRLAAAQNDLNLKVAKTLASIRTLLAQRYSVSDPSED